MSSAKELMAIVKSKRDRVVVAAVVACFCALTKAQKTAFFGLANQLVFLSQKGQQQVLKDLDDEGLMPPFDDILLVAARQIKGTAK